MALIIQRRQEDGVFIELTDASGVLAAYLSCEDWCSIVGELSQYEGVDPGTIAAVKDLHGIAETQPTVF